MNAIQDSVALIRRHGLIPDISDDSNLKDILPPLSTLVDHFKANDKTMTKQACIDVIQCYFRDGKDGLLGAVASRMFNQQSFYNEPTSFIVFLKLFHAEFLRSTHASNKDAAFLVGGRYHGCKAKQPHMRDSIFVVSDDTISDSKKVVAFGQLRLASNAIYLSPRVTGGYFFSEKNTRACDIKKSKILTRKMKLWITANGDDPYISSQDDVQSDGDNQEECGDDKVGKKTFTKKQFGEPMRILQTALGGLRAKLGKRNDISPLLDKVLIGYNVIADMTSHGTLFEVSNQDTNDNNRDNNDDGGNDDSSDDSSGSSESSESDASNGIDENNNSTSNSEVPQDESNGNDDTAQKKASDDSSGSSDSSENNAGTASGDENNNSTSNNEVTQDKSNGDDGTAEEKGIAETDVSGKAGPDKIIHIRNETDICQDDEFNLDSINACFKSLHGDEIDCGVMSGRDIQALLGLAKIPNLRIANHKKYFYSISSDKMKKITQLYEKKKDASKLNNSKPTLITELVACLFHLKSNDWHNSIDALPAGTTIMDGDVLLLWKENPQFVDLFMTQGDSASTSANPRTSPRKSPPARDEK